MGTYKQLTHFTPGGCAQCSGIGSKRRLPLYELFEPNLNAWNMIADGDSEKILRTMLKDKQQTLFDHGLQLVSQGLTTWSEIERVTLN